MAPAKLKYPLFGDEGVDEFECVDLRTSQNYSWSFEGGNSDSHDTFVREVFSRDTQRDMGQPYTRSRYYHLYLDGQYWGLYQTQERSESSYAASYFGGDKDDYDVIKSRAGNGGYDIEATDGTLDNWRLLWDAAGSGFGNDATYYRVQGLNPDGTRNPSYPKLLDVDNLIDYMLCTYYVGDPDGPVSAWARVANNFYAIYNRVNPDGFKFFRHDAEHSLYDLQESRLFAATTVAVGSCFNQSNPLWMHTHLMAHPEYRMRFADRVYKYFFNDGVLTPKACTDRFMARVHQIETAIIAESARWGDAKRSKPRTKDDDWLPDINRMIANYFPARTGVVFNQFKSQGWWPNADPPTMNTHGGHVAAGFSLQMSSSGHDLLHARRHRPSDSGNNARSPRRPVLVAENAAKRVLVPTAGGQRRVEIGPGFQRAAWQSGSGGVGYERSTGYQTLFTINVQSQMYGKGHSCYIRIPFTVTAEALQGLASMMLRVRYDDGFVAYLNGVEVQRALFNGTPAWNSAASASHPDADAENFETFDISSGISALQCRHESAGHSRLERLDHEFGFPELGRIVGRQRTGGRRLGQRRLAFGDPIYRADHALREHRGQSPRLERHGLERPERGGLCRRAGGREPADQRTDVPSARYRQSQRSQYRIRRADQHRQSEHQPQPGAVHQGNRLHLPQLRSARRRLLSGGQGSRGFPRPIWLQAARRRAVYRQSEQWRRARRVG